MTQNRTTKPRRTRTSEPDQLPKLCGADIELGNFILGVRSSRGTGYEASRLLLAEVEGLPRAGKYRGEPCDCVACRRAREEASRAQSSRGNGSEKTRIIGNPQDWGRKYLPSNGGCAYIDLDHLELCLPEVLSAYDHVACWHAMLKLARAAMEAANRKLPVANKIQVLANNSDGSGNSYGSHLNFLLTRRAWNNIFRRKIHYMLYLAAFQASSIVYTGQGKVGSEIKRADCDFQLSQRADFFERLVGSQTTHNRPIVNSRDESLCGSGIGDDEASDMARLHVIFFDNTLCHVASLLKVGVMQIVLAMIEAEKVNLALLLDDPIDALRKWSRDPELGARASLTTGERLTAVEHQLRFAEDAKRFVSDGGCEGIVPRAVEILELWEDTLLKLRARDFKSLAERLDWVLKRTILQQVLDARSDLSWHSPELKHLDHLYSSLDESEGLYWAYEREGIVERVASEPTIERFIENPPEDTRAWTRAMVLRCAGPESVDDVDWDSIRLNVGRYRKAFRKIDLSNPLRHTKLDSERWLEQATTIEELCDLLGARTDEGRSAGKSKKGRNGSPVSVGRQIAQ